MRLATNLMKLHAKDEDKIRGLIEMLATRLGSHDYLIGPTEARELKLHVADENGDLMALDFGWVFQHRWNHFQFD